MSFSSALKAFRLELDPKTDILALAAFFISIGGLLYQGVLAIKKPDVLQFPPEQILFYPEPSNGVDYLQVGAQSTYVNKGRGERNAVLKVERLLFELGGRSYELKWQTFVNYSNDKNKLVIGDPRPAIPAVIKSGEGTSHETHFAPRSFHVAVQSDKERYKNFLPWDLFVSELEKVKELDMRILSEFYGLEDKEAHIYLEVTPGVIHALKTDRWAAPSAWPRESPSSFFNCQTSVPPRQRDSDPSPVPSPSAIK